MIITLTGANFSANNIGTLNYWMVTRSLSGFSSSSTVSTVIKNGSYNATFTLLAGYQFVEGGAVITMGDTDVTTSVLTWNSENTVATVAIPNATGNIHISLVATLI